MAHPVSVIVPTFERPALLADCLASVLAQTYRPLEILIGDDSRDRTAEQVARNVTGSGGRVSLRYFHHRPGLGQAGNVNSLLAHASSTHVVLIHDDDRLMPEAVSLLREALLSHPEAVVAYGRQRVISEAGADMGDALAEHVQGCSVAATTERAFNQTRSPQRCCVS